MSRIITTAIMMGTLVLGARATANAQVKVIPGERLTQSATVEAIEESTRTVVVRMTNGDLRTLEAPAASTKLTEIHVGDTVNVTYYENMIVRVKAPGEPDVDTKEGAITRAGGAQPGATGAIQQTITATITAVDMNVPSISLKGPRGWSYSTKVQDKKALSQVKVGDRVDITWTEAVLVGVAPGKK